MVDGLETIKERMRAEGEECRLLQENNLNKAYQLKDTPPTANTEKQETETKSAKDNFGKN